LFTKVVQIWQTTKYFAKFAPLYFDSLKQLVLSDAKHNRDETKCTLNLRETIIFRQKEAFFDVSRNCGLREGKKFR